jgi:addiction module HigA family antidote
LDVDSKLLIHPGEILKEEFLVPYGLSANRLAKAIGVPTNRITEIVNGTRNITGETAVLLGHAFGTTPEFWLNLQSRYELDLASTRVSRDSIRRADQFARELRAA